MKKSITTFLMLLFLCISFRAYSLEPMRGNSTNITPYTMFDGVSPIHPQVDGQVSLSFPEEWYYASKYPDWFADPMHQYCNAGFFWYEHRNGWTATSSSSSITFYPGTAFFIAHDIEGQSNDPLLAFRQQENNDWNVAETYIAGVKVKCWILGNDDKTDDSGWINFSDGLQFSHLIPEDGDHSNNNLITDVGFIVRYNDDPSTDVHWFPGMAEPGDPGWNWSAFYGAFGAYGFNNSFSIYGEDAIDNEVYEWVFYRGSADPNNPDDVSGPIGTPPMPPILDSLETRTVIIDPPKDTIVFIAPNWWIHFMPPPWPGAPGGPGPGIEVKSGRDIRIKAGILTKAQVFLRNRSSVAKKILVKPKLKKTSSDWWVDSFFDVFTKIDLGPGSHWVPEAPIDPPDLGSEWTILEFEFNTNPEIPILGLNNTIIFEIFEAVEDPGNPVGFIPGEKLGETEIQIMPDAPAPDIALWFNPQSLTHHEDGDHIRYWDDCSPKWVHEEAYMDLEARRPRYVESSAEPGIFVNFPSPDLPGVHFDGDIGHGSYGQSDIMISHYSHEVTTGMDNLWMPDPAAKDFFIVFKPQTPLEGDIPYYSDGRQTLFEIGGPMSGMNLYYYNNQLCFGFWNRYQSKFYALGISDPELLGSFPWLEYLSPLESTFTYLLHVGYSPETDELRIGIGIDNIEQFIYFPIQNSGFGFDGFSQDGMDFSAIGGAARTCYHDYNTGETYSNHFSGVIGDVILLNNGDTEHTIWVPDESYQEEPYPGYRPETMQQNDWVTAYLLQKYFMGGEYGKRPAMASEIIKSLDPVSRDFNQSLGLPSPNPCRDICNVNISLDESGAISLSLFDVSGKKVMDIFNGNQAKGSQTYRIDTENLNPGIFYLRLEFGGRTEVQKIVVIR